MDRCLAIKINETCHVQTLVNLEGTMLSEISRTKSNTIWSHLNVESKGQTHRLRAVD